MNELPENLDRQLNILLAAARSEYTEMPPPSLESGLRREFRTVRPKMRRRSLWWAAAGVSGAAAAAVALLLFNTAPIKTAPVKTFPNTARVEVRKLPDIPATPVKRTARRKHRTASPRSIPRETPDFENTAGFTAIPYTDSGREAQQLDVYRVQMPRAIVAKFGLPMNAEGFDSTVTADVLVGNDGVARAIKFVH